MTYRRTILLLPVLFLLSLSAGVSRTHAMDPRFELDPVTLEKNLPPGTVPASLPGKKAKPLPAKGEKIHTTRSGVPRPGKEKRDNGISGRRAEAGKKRGNRPQVAVGVEAGKRDRVRHHAKSGKRGSRPVRSAGFKRAARPGSAAVTHRLSLFRTSAEPAGDGIAGARLVWDRLLPAMNPVNSSYAIKGGSFSLDLDPERFPVFPAAEGKKIVVEAGGRLSPLVRSLIEQNDPGTRFVNYSPGTRKRFFADLLAAAGFYSVEEDFSVSFGSDPQLTVTTDFKVENDSESPIQQAIYLFNADPGRGSFPPVLSSYMDGQGFRVIDISPPARGAKPRTVGAIGVISEREPSAMADRLLSSLDLKYQRDLEVELFSLGEGGIGLKVKVDRFFRKNGKKYVVGFLKGDPESYTLLRLLETMGYRVVMISPDEDFRSVAEKLLSQLHLPGRYAMEELLPFAELPYSIRMSGIMVNSPDRGGKLFLTEKRPDPVITELLRLNGYVVRDGKDEVVRK